MASVVLNAGSPLDNYLRGGYSLSSNDVGCDPFVGTGTSLVTWTY